MGHDCKSSIYWIEDETDDELQAAWRQLADSKGSSSGWQYQGSALTTQGWGHHFLNKQLRDEAEIEDDLDDARAVVPASKDWNPQKPKPRRAPRRRL